MAFKGGDLSAEPRKSKGVSSEIRKSSSAFPPCFGQLKMDGSESIFIHLHLEPASGSLCLVVGDAQIHEHPVHLLALKRFLHLTEGSMEDLET